MQRIVSLVVAMVAVGGSVGEADAQKATGATLWRVAATTLPRPHALVTGVTAVLWNPAQADDNGTQLGFEAIQTPASVGASGVLAAVRLSAGRLGRIGFIYGRMGLNDVSRTEESPDPIGSAIPVYTFAVGGTWSRMIATTAVGATLAFHETRLDAARAGRWTLDLGASRSFANDRVRIAAATHFFSSLSATDPAQDMYAAVEARLWRAPVSGTPAMIHGRYGLTFAHGFTADHQIGLGAQVAETLTLDFMLAREGGYSSAGWRPVGGLRLAIGKYRVTLARDAGVNELGSAYRVGVDVHLR